MHTKGPHISIKPEILTEVFGFPITNSFITALIVILIFIGIGIYYKNQLSSANKSLFFYVLHFILKSLYDFFSTLVGSKIDMFYPLFGSLFLYILLLNWFGLLPGVGSLLITVHTEHGEEVVPLLRGTTADLNTTLALALVTFSVTQYLGVKYLGLKGYLKKFFNLANPINFVVGILELVSEFSRIVSFSFRLFGNIFAGEVMLAIMAFLIPFFVPFPFFVMEVFVGFVQALVFSMLTAVFINLAITQHH